MTLSFKKLILIRRILGVGDKVHKNAKKKTPRISEKYGVNQRMRETYIESY